MSINSNLNSPEQKTGRSGPNEPNKFVLESPTPTYYANTEIFPKRMPRRFPEDDGKLFTHVFEADE